MKFDIEDIKKYQDLCREHFGEEVDEAEAVGELNSLMLLVNLMYRPQIKAYLASAAGAARDSAGHEEESRR